MSDNIILHTHSLPMTGGTKSSLEMCRNLIEKNINVIIVLENDNIEVDIDFDVNIKVLTAKGLISPRRLISPRYDYTKRDDIKVNVLTKYPKVRSFLMWVRYLKNLSLFPAKYIQMKKFIRFNDINAVISNNMYNDLEHLFFYNGLNKMLSIRNSPKEVFFRRKQPKIFSLNRYMKDVTFIPVSKDSEIELCELFPKNKVKTIYNPFDFDKINKKSREGTEIVNPNPFFVSVGSLCKRKRVDLTISAFSKIKNDNVNLMIIGNGAEKLNLIRLTEKLGIKDRVLFVGNIDNPYIYMKSAIATVLTSESEGLPRVLVESLILKTPIISTDCPTGPAELLNLEYKDYLIEMRDDRYIIDNISQCMNNMMDRYNNNNKIEMNISLERFKPSNIIADWLNLLEN
ncbi:hypothetical protein CTM97_21695 [Photobacterium phosphoreum]|uniref:Glycosyl transferase family 1 domain-containing protein n=1 Tax=Photobacterium phosphoreum TaxID=659 RepID=A0A2T3JFU5_PHOPO|nr:glycosyltransferase [Photobacterium phosphoreum]PSU17624.1 hypothetical protein CTM96_21705 [Photobacterium phosphoreum]PSU34523.1 hypothetical protein CTM97_21695 [Photobacterium phosphoreum]PSU47796.1 hypothetical protein C9J18_18405 [Photobacterium phosphoreum]